MIKDYFKATAKVLGVNFITQLVFRALLLLGIIRYRDVQKGHSGSYNLIVYIALIFVTLALMYAINLFSGCNKEQIIVMLVELILLSALNIVLDTEVFNINEYGIFVVLKRLNGTRGFHIKAVFIDKIAAALSTGLMVLFAYLGNISGDN